MLNHMKKAYLLNAVAVVALFFLIQYLIAQGVITRYYQGILILICINIVLAVSLNLTTGVLGQIALGHAGFMAIGAYTSAIVTKSMGVGVQDDFATFTYLGALLVGGICAAFIGLLVGLPALRLRGDYLAIITLGFGEIIRVVIENIGITGGAQGLSGIAKISKFPVVFWITVLALFLMFALKRSRHGRAILSIREDEIAAESSGINTIYYKTLAFVVAAFFAGVAGGMFAHYLGIIGAQSFGFLKSVDILVIVVLGGMGSFTGSIVAAILLTILPEALREFVDYRMLVYSAILILMMIFKPSGLFGQFEFSLYYIKRDVTQWLNKFRKKSKEKRG